VLVEMQQDLVQVVLVDQLLLLEQPQQVEMVGDLVVTLQMVPHLLLDQQYIHFSQQQQLAVEVVVDLVVELQQVMEQVLV
jgi:hypothetical protein